jgi:tetraacyldisaccharide 4'-kinase
MSWGNPQSANEKALATLLAPVSFCYSLGNRLNALSYQLKIRKRYRASIPVVSVGNITVGGTGKTPLVISIAQIFGAQGLKVGIASRGYKRDSTKPIVIAGDGNGRFAAVHETGDEPQLIARSVPSAVVITSSNRALASKMLAERFNCDVIILDDGFQHYRMERDLDIVLIDYADYPTNDRVLPAGRLREELNGLNRADHIVITKVPTEIDQTHWQYLESTIKHLAPDRAISACRFVADKLVYADRKPNSEISPTELAGVSVVAFSAIARPETFIQSLNALGANVIVEKRFSDHYSYTHADLELLTKLKTVSSAAYLVTTAKDAVKLPHSQDFDTLILEQKVEWLTAPPTEFNAIIERIKETNQPKINVKSDRNSFSAKAKLEQNAIHSK